ncbi:MAG: TetR/AcrR family transcriptional regulator C-terminal domain-containing protein [Oscillospiraceae bacterium]|nr:TetR/AcrR family transcriptional regulator C-terminal domain-containing protein [Oscillospiraceae bacterium]
MVRKTTKEILAESFIELAAQKSINRISILDIVENCSLTKPTFYRYFKDKYDLITWIYIREAQKNLSKIGKNGYLWKDTLLDGLHYYEENRKFMLNALKHTSGRDSFIQQINRVDVELITSEIQKKLDADRIPADLNAMIRIYCYGTGQYLCDWLMDSKPASCESVATVMEACIPEQLRPFLCE